MIPDQHLDDAVAVAPMSREPHHAPASPEEATQRDQVRLFFRFFVPAAIAFAIAETAVGVVFASPQALITAAMVCALGVWVQWVARPALETRAVSVVVLRASLGITAVAVAATLVQPVVGIVATVAMLIPTAFALPFLAVGSLRRLMLIAWGAIIVTAAVGVWVADTSIPPFAQSLVQLWGLALASGLVLFLLYRSSESLKASAREFRRLLILSTDLAETTEPGLLGDLAARHLAEAVGFDDCIIYALSQEADQLAPFGSYPPDRALSATPQTLGARPALGRVVGDRQHQLIDGADARADPAERARLVGLGRRVTLLMPLVARTDVVGVAELGATEARSVDDRRLALAQTLAFQATMAIENGRLYQQLRHRSLHDPLTGLANRSLFYDRVEHALARLSRPGGGMVAVLFIDLDDFKVVNDTLGHARGDRLLAMVAERLRAVARPVDTVSRLGGDEFAMLLDDLPSAEEAHAVAGRAVDALTTPFALADQMTRVAASIGIATTSAPAASVDSLVHDADVAMYEAKRDGKGRAVLFAPEPQG